MNTLYHDGDFDTAQPHGARRWIIPFAGEGDNLAYIYEQDYVQKIEKFVPRTLSSPGDIAGYFLVSESQVESIGGGIGRWTRTFARKPNPRTQWESFAWRVPGLSADASPFPVVVDNTLTQRNSGGSTLIYTSSPHSLQPGDGVVIRYNIKFNDGTAETTHMVFRNVLTVPINNRSFTVALINEDVTLWQSINEAGGRRSVTRVVTSKLELAYFHCAALGGDFKSPELIPLFRQDLIFNALNEESDSYSPTTTPTLAEYQAQILAGEWVIAESSIIRRWMGNFYERSTRLVKAE